MDTGFNPNDPIYAGYERKKRDGGNAFVTVVIVVVLLLLAALLFALFTSEARREEAVLPQASSTPGPSAALDFGFGLFATPTPTPFAPSNTATPIPAGNEMPTIDGVVPNLPLTSDNPIPDIYDAVAESMVGVVNYTESVANGRKMLDIYGSGSGFIVSSEGYVLTNAHVIDSASAVTVLLASGEEVPADIVGFDKETDVAVLLIDGKGLGLKAVACGDSDAVRVGEYVLAIGNPLDTSELANTITFGIISAKSREITIDSYTNTYLQTDAAINFGNSGGPLLNMRGEVIGMNSAKSITAGYDAYGNSIAAEGIGFALPINTVLEIMEQLVKDGKITRPGIGITVSTITELMAESAATPVGAYVENVVKGGPADKGGLLKGDIIVEANGKKITEHPELVALVQSLMIGDTLTLHVYRNGQYVDVTIAIANKTDMDFADVVE